MNCMKYEGSLIYDVLQQALHRHLNRPNIIDKMNNNIYILINEHLRYNIFLPSQLNVIALTPACKVGRAIRTGCFFVRFPLGGGSTPSNFRTSDFLPSPRCSDTSCSPQPPPLSCYRHSQQETAPFRYNYTCSPFNVSP